MCLVFCHCNIQLRFQDKNLHMDIRLGALRLYRKHLVDQLQEVLMRTLETVMKQCKDCHQPPPNTLVVVGDNTVKELKNSVCLSYLASLVNHGRLQFLAPLASFCFYALIIIVLVNHCLSFSIFLLLCLDNYCVCQPLFVNHYCSWSKMIQTFKKKTVAIVVFEMANKVLMRNDDACEPHAWRHWWLGWIGNWF